MSDHTEAAFEFGKIVAKTFIDMEDSKCASSELVRSIGGDEQERIVLQKIGKYWNRRNYFDRPDGLIVVTSHRFIFLSKLKSITVTTDYLSFPLERISGVKATRIMYISPAIQFIFDSQEFVFTFLFDAQAAVNATLNCKAKLLATVEGRHRRSHGE